MEASLKSLIVIISLTPSGGNGTRDETRFVSSVAKTKIFPLRSDFIDTRVRVTSTTSPAIGYPALESNHTGFP
jgi:hypothetical protein